MIKQFALYSAIMVMLVTSVPLIASAAVSNNPNALSGGKAKPQITVQFGSRNRRRWRANNRWVTGYRTYRPGWQYRTFPEYYTYGGRRRVRQVRYYYRF